MSRAGGWVRRAAHHCRMPARLPCPSCLLHLPPTLCPLHLAHQPPSPSLIRLARSLLLIDKRSQPNLSTSCLPCTGAPRDPVDRADQPAVPRADVWRRPLRSLHGVGSDARQGLPRQRFRGGAGATRKTDRNATPHAEVTVCGGRVGGMTGRGRRCNGNDVSVTSTDCRTPPSCSACLYGGRSDEPRADARQAFAAACWPSAPFLFLLSPQTSSAD